MSEHDTVITGLGAVSALGVGCEAMSRVLYEPRSGIAPIRRFSTEGFRTTLGAMVPGFERVTDRDTCLVFAGLAADEALAMARLDAASLRSRRVALVLGSSLGSGRARLSELTDVFAERLGVGGARITVSTACSSSSTAVGLGRDLLLAGAADLVIAGGTDVLSDELFAGFDALGVLSSEPCAPFSVRLGTTLGEGAGLVVLESRAHAEGRGVSPLATLLGYGLSGDAYHATSPDPTGSGIARAVRCALLDAGLTPADIDYVNAHGTGTEANDVAEMAGLRAALGARTASVPVSSSKSFLGHAQGAAGILELIVTILGLRAGRLPPTLHFATPRRGAPEDPVPSPVASGARVALSLNAAFAGANSAVVVAVPSVTTAPRRNVRPVYVRGAAVLAGAPSSLGALRGAVERGERIGRRVEPFDVAHELPLAEPRGLDLSTRLLASAVARALVDAGLSVRGAQRERTGIISAVSASSAEAAAEFRRSIERRGLQRLNATAFARLVLNASTGATAKLLSLRGPTTTLTTGRGGGAVAVAHAAELLSRGDGDDTLVAAAVDERGFLDDGEDAAEGAAALVLGSTPDTEPAVVLRRWAIASPGDGVADAARDALAGVDVDLVVDVVARTVLATRAARLTLAPSLGDARAASSLIACALAVDALRSRLVRRVLVLSRGDGASAALLFEGGEA